MSHNLEEIRLDAATEVPLLKWRENYPVLRRFSSRCAALLGANVPHSLIDEVVPLVERSINGQIDYAVAGSVRVRLASLLDELSGRMSEAEAAVQAGQESAEVFWQARMSYSNCRGALACLEADPFRSAIDTAAAVRDYFYFHYHSVGLDRLANQLTILHDGLSNDLTIDYVLRDKVCAPFPHPFGSSGDRPSSLLVRDPETTLAAIIRKLPLSIRSLLCYLNAAYLDGIAHASLDLLTDTYPALDPRLNRLLSEIRMRAPSNPMDRDQLHHQAEVLLQEYESMMSSDDLELVNDQEWVHIHQDVAFAATLCVADDPRLGAAHAAAHSLSRFQDYHFGCIVQQIRQMACDIS